MLVRNCAILPDGTQATTEMRYFIQRFIFCSISLFQNFPGMILLLNTQMIEKQSKIFPRAELKYSAHQEGYTTISVQQCSFIE